MPKAKTEGAGFFSNSEKAKLQRLYRNGKAAYGSIKNLQKASGLSKKKVAYFLHSKDSYTKYRHATRHFKRLPALRYKRISEIWCLDLAFIDKLLDTNNGVKYLLVCVDVFSRSVRVQPMKSKYSTDAVVALKKLLRKKSMPAKVWVDQGTEFSAEFRKYCTDKKIKIYYTRSEKKAVVAERAIKSLKNIIYRYMEVNGDKYMRKMDSFLKTMNTRVNHSIGKAPKNVTSKDFLSFFLALKLVKMFEYQKKLFHSEKVINLSSQMKSSKLLKLLLLNHQPITFVENKVMKF